MLSNIATESEKNDNETESGNDIDGFETYTNKMKSPPPPKKLHILHRFKYIFFERCHKFVIDYKNNPEKYFILNHTSSNELFLNDLIFIVPSEEKLR